jgi:hypothetical protein
MKPVPAYATVFVLVFTTFISLSFSKKTAQSARQTIAVGGPKIQAAILLDVSSSMNGLIDQAKAQLWNMVSVMGRVKCENGIPKIEIALYEYGRSENDPAVGYIRQISSFTSDLDKLSQELFTLTTNGGDEYCGHVIHTSLDELRWDSSSSNYKVIFIAGNEDFLQGKIPYSQSCAEAKRKGVIVNTIYCGNKEEGIREHWNLAGECGNGSYTNIDQNLKMEDIATPYDSLIFSYNNQLNGTYLGYGELGVYNYAQQRKVDNLNMNLNKNVQAKRAAVKANKQLYTNSSWDLVDAAEHDSTFITKVEMKTLPDSLKNKTREELKQIVEEKTAERNKVQQQIISLNKQRESYIAAERVKGAANNSQPTLESEVEKIIKQQVTRFKMRVE